MLNNTATHHTLPPGNSVSIARRFRRTSIILFAIVFMVMAAVMLYIFSRVITWVSLDYTESFAASSAEALSGHINREVGLMGKAVRSPEVIAWLQDEDNTDKKSAALGELKAIVNELHSYNLYIGVVNSSNEYTVQRISTPEIFLPFATLNREVAEDAWFFTCLDSPLEYRVSVGTDHVLQRDRMWLDYKVSLEGTPLGVICTGLEYGHIAGELFANFDKATMIGSVFDSSGKVHMSSSQSNMLDAAASFNFRGENVRAGNDDPILAAVQGYVQQRSDTGLQLPVAYSLPGGEYLSIAPIRGTDWYIAILSQGISIFSPTLFMPLAATVFALLVITALLSTLLTHRIIFSPLAMLGESLGLLSANQEARIYGTERQDELGELSRTIEDLFRKANIDTLTGIYNRRYMENNLLRLVEQLSRSGTSLSVLMLDIDFFKKYNDTYGHDQGDECLREVATTLNQNVSRADDFVARYGGEEFIVVLPNTDQAGACVVAQKLLQAVRSIKIPHTASSIAPYVTVSIGVTTGRVSHKQGWGSYVKRADEALYSSKQNGRDQYTFLAYSGLVTGASND
ncbi:MAG: GGDEF domain-containing protein [Symbiobacteriaceae bacterium]|nr:GGDEF domain-containing protein [Symbiobacteriaceae bacterium]